MRFSLLILLLPIIELWLMIKVGAEVGALAIIAWLIAMIVIGVNLLRYLGASSMLRGAQAMQRGAGLPAQDLADNLFKALGAVLLIIPGLLTDVLALLCFVPLLRRLILKRWLAKMAASASVKGFYQAHSGAKHDPFGAAGGNVYEHQPGPTAPHQDSPTGLIIDQPSEPKGTDKPKKP